MKTTVVNLRREPFDVYIGRGGKGRSGYFGNPYRLRQGEERSDVMAAFRRYFLDRIDVDPEFRQRVLELKSKRLGCFCKPASCHGDIIAEWVDAQ